ncbi:MAG: class I SAM-dependent DNA methyltransferase, partial [Spirochaetes bacterium]|nr:class I SAM-dependent DNA methyltransferase [Spirochaetota bacterium]
AFLVEACRQLGDALVEAWHAHGEVPAIPPDEREDIYAMRMIAQRCLYGVDKNPVAVDLAKVSLWLATLAKDHALTFVDHALRHGDSLVGLSRKQIEAFHWDPDAPEFRAGFETMRVREHVAKVAELRQRIREAGESISDWELRDLWDEAQFELGKVRLFGDLVLAAFFEGEKPKEREAKRSEYASAVVNGDTERCRDWLDEWRHAERPLVPFHWEIEFPEVFERENPGFDAFVGNPPFMGGSKISAAFGPCYLAHLLEMHDGSHGNADIVAHFFRRVFGLLRVSGAAGLIATSTISRGDTRGSGLVWITANGGRIFVAERRREWPGSASLLISVVHFCRGRDGSPARTILDGKAVDRITPFLLDRGGDSDPCRLDVNKALAFGGAKIYGQGFLVSPEERTELVSADPKNAERIAVYLGGNDVNDNPHRVIRRYVINLHSLTLEEARGWPRLLSIVEERVRPERNLHITNEIALRQKEYWWRYRSDTPVLRSAAAALPNVLTCVLHTSHLSFDFWPAAAVFSHGLAVVAVGTYSAFAVLQSQLHTDWARMFGSFLGNALRYTPQDCFETFPFPLGHCSETSTAVEAAGHAYYESRAAFMVRNDEGLTKTYNRFHDPDDCDLDVLKLRELHAAMDRAVLDAYGWGDIKTDCEFLLDYEIDEEEWGDRKKPYRYRWPDDVRDEVLARLLELNAERAKEEARSGATAARAGRKKAGSKRAPGGPEAADLFEPSPGGGS